MDLKFRGKVAVLAGASVGIGLAFADGFATEGVNLVLAARQHERLEQVTADIAMRHGVRVVPVACDVATMKGVDALDEAAKPTVRRCRHPVQQRMH